MASDEISGLIPVSCAQCLPFDEKWQQLNKYHTTMSNNDNDNGNDNNKDNNNSDNGHLFSDKIISIEYKVIYTLCTVK